MTTFTIVNFEDTHHEWAAHFVQREWGSLRQVSRGILYNVLEYPGFIAVVDHNPEGLVLYRITDEECEILLLHSAIEGIGVGAALIEHVKKQARIAGCKRLWLITTNDNIHAFRWYQRHGFTISAVYVNALERSRKLKPEIPLLGNEGIPLRDEIEFELLLK